MVTRFPLRLRAPRFRGTRSARRAAVAVSLATGLLVVGCGAGAARTAGAPTPPPSVATKTETGQATQPDYTAKMQLPQLTWAADPAVAARVNAAVQSWAKQQETAFVARATQSAAAAKNMPASLPPGSLTISYHVGMVTTSLVSYEFQLESAVRGQADMTQQPAGLTFGLAAGTRYTLAGLFRSGNGYVSTLASAAGRGLAAFAPGGARCYLGQAPTADAANFGAWWLTPSGLVLSFPAGTYTAAYCGVPTVTVDYVGLKAVVAPNSPLPGA